jgi:hypothetical protein
MYIAIKPNGWGGGGVDFSKNGSGSYVVDTALSLHPVLENHRLLQFKQVYYPSHKRTVYTEMCLKVVFYIFSPRDYIFRRRNFEIVRENGKISSSYYI